MRWRSGGGIGALFNMRRRLLTCAERVGSGALSETATAQNTAKSTRRLTAQTLFGYDDGAASHLPPATVLQVQLRG